MMVAGEPTIDVTSKLGSAFVEDEYQPRLTQFVELRDAGFPGIVGAANLLPRVHSNATVLDVGEDCIYAETLISFSGIFADPPPDENSFVQLGPPDRGLVDDRNPTPWMVHAFPVGEEAEMRERTPCDS